MGTLKSGNVGRFNPCPDGCYHIDIIDSMQDRRVRSFSKTAEILWTGAADYNNAGQHPEPELGCDLAVYHFDISAGTIEQGRRDALTGEDIEVRWTQPLGDYITSYLAEFASLGVSWQPFAFPIYQSYDGLFATVIPGVVDQFAAPAIQRYSAIQVRDFQTGEEVWTAVVRFETTTILFDVATNFFSDILPRNDGALTFSTKRVSDLGDVRAAELSLETGPAPGPPYYTPYLSEFTPCGGTTIPGVLLDDGLLFTHSAVGSPIDGVNLGDSHGRPSFARYQGIYSFTENYADKNNWTSHSGGQAACDHTYLGSGYDTQIYGSRFSSPHCQRIYHVPHRSISTELLGREDVVLRFNPETEQTDELPFALIGSTAREWHHVVKDTYPDADGTNPPDRCDAETLCGDGGAGAEQPECCFDGEGQPHLQIHIENEGFGIPEPCEFQGEDCLEPPNELWGCYFFDVSAILVGGCPDDEIVHLEIEHVVLPNRPGAIRCRHEYPNQYPDFWQLWDTWHLVGEGCYDFRVVARTLKGCTASATVRPDFAIDNCAS